MAGNLGQLGARGGQEWCPGGRREWRRVLLLVVVNVVGMAAIMLLFAALTPVRYPRWWAIEVAAYLGPIFGLLLSPLTAGLLWDTRLPRSLPLVYGVPAALSVGLIWLLPDSARSYSGFMTIGGVCIISAICRKLLIDHERIEQRAQMDRRLCPRCHYDLHNLTDFGCPECGWGRAVDASSSTQDR